MRRTELEAPEFLARLRNGDEAAYRDLIRRLHGSLVGLAATIIGSRAQAEEVVQDAWLAVFSGVGAFEGRSSLVTWVFSIVLNRARTRASREGRLVGLPALMEGTDPAGRAVDLSEFKPDGHWIEAPRLWDELSPERIVGGRQLRDRVMAEIDRLPAGQRAVILLRDIEGCGASEACTLLGITAENQRVLLHRARGRIRKVIDAVIGSPRPERVPTSAAPDRGGAESTALERLAALLRLFCDFAANRRVAAPRNGAIVELLDLREGGNGPAQGKEYHRGTQERRADASDRTSAIPAARDGSGESDRSDPAAPRGGMEPHVRAGRVEEPVHPVGRLICRNRRPMSAPSRRACRSTGMHCASIWRSTGCTSTMIRRPGNSLAGSPI
ncbi:MAG: sigma-70 family RNA polymerase sigma factor [Acetobacteraceae bacterium]|nr:sigma-70 family RNA polymerase sigma factor [Acetobacteraceae bacterium]